jgi:hypothetical protein
MFYLFKCTYCGRQFYTFESGDKWLAAQRLYDAVKAHLQEYNEDDKEYEMDDGRYEDSNQIYKEMTSQSKEPEGAYEV